MNPGKEIDIPTDNKVLRGLWYAFLVGVAKHDVEDKDFRCLDLLINDHNAGEVWIGYAKRRTVAITELNEFADENELQNLWPKFEKCSGLHDEWKRLRECQAAALQAKFLGAVVALLIDPARLSKLACQRRKAISNSQEAQPA